MRPGRRLWHHTARFWLQAVRDLFGNEAPFWQECKHHGVHVERCTKCDEFVLLQTDIRLAIDELAVVAEREKLLAVAARWFGSDAGILRYIAHLVRDFHQGKYRDDVLRKMLMHPEAGFATEAGCFGFWPKDSASLHQVQISVFLGQSLGSACLQSSRPAND